MVENFRITGLDPGFLRVEVAAPHHLQAQVDVGLQEGETRQLELRLQPAVRLSGQVLDPDDRPLAGARLQVSQPNLQGAGGESGDDGAFALENLAAGEANLVVTAKGYEPWAQAITVPGDELKVHLTSGAVIQGTVEGPSGPVPGASVVALIEASRGQTVGARTDAHGAFELRGLIAGRVRVVVNANGFIPYEARSVEVVGGAPTPLSIHLNPGLSLSGTVVDDLGHPLAGAHVDANLQKRPARPFSAEAVSAEATGAFAMSGLPAGLYRLSAFLEGFQQDEPAEAQAGSSDLRVVLERPATVRGRVETTRGAPVLEFAVNGQEMNSRDGSFEIDDVAPGTSPNLDHGRLCRAQRRGPGQTRRGAGPGDHRGG